MGNPLDFILTPGQAHDLEGADALLPDMAAETLLADKAFDADERVIEPSLARGKTFVIPPGIRGRFNAISTKTPTRHATSSRISSASSSNTAPSPLATTKPPEISSPQSISRPLSSLKHRDLYPWQITATRHGNSPPAKELPKEAKEYLRPNNPRLLELKARYSNFDPKVTTADVWQDGIIQASDLASFRRDNPYVWQVRGRKQNVNDLSYALTYYALKASDSTRDVLASLDEDDLFGVHLFQADGRNISRDLLDSVREIEFIRKHVNIDAPDTSILDIGAGYGRLVYRLSQTSPTGVRVFGTDAIAELTFLSEFYLRFRSADRATVVPLDEIDAFFASTSIKLVTNIHSFSECTMDAIEWWVQRLSAAGGQTFW